MEQLQICQRRISMSKKRIRENMKAVKSLLTENEIVEYSDMIFHKLEEYISPGDYDAIYTYVAFNEEVKTSAVINYAFHNHIKLAVPKIEHKRMEFYYINRMEDLSPGYYGILEPKTTQKAMDRSILMIVPGLAFDKECNRLGYGAGYYDRYFKNYEHLSVNKIALAYDFQIVKNLEAAPYDKKVDHIITPTRLIHRRSD